MAQYLPFLQTRNIKEKLVRLSGAIGLYLASSAVQILTIKYAEMHHTKRRELLNDFSFEYLPELSQDSGPLWVARLLLVCVLIGVLSILVHRQGLVIFRRICNVLSLLYLSRSLCMIGTQYPDPQFVCKDFNYENSDFLHILEAQTCGDMMPSGHTFHMIIGVLAMHSYTRNFYVKYLVALPAMAGMTLLLLAHFHYTDDVIVAALLSFLWWTVYHAYLSDARLKRAFWLYRWFEGHDGPRRRQSVSLLAHDTVDRIEKEHEYADAVLFGAHDIQGDEDDEDEKDANDIEKQL